MSKPAIPSERVGITVPLFTISPLKPTVLGKKDLALPWKVILIALC